MPSGIIKLDDKYFIYSTIVDNMTAGPFNKRQLQKWIEYEEGRQGLERLPRRLERVEESGTSFIGEDLESTLICNRSGPKESFLSVEEIKRAYLYREPVRGYILDEHWRWVPHSPTAPNFRQNADNTRDDDGQTTVVTGVTE